MRERYTFTEPPYSLHDCPVTFVHDGDTLTLVTEYGMKSTRPPHMTKTGRVEFEGLDWDFCHAYILPSAGHYGRFEGEKLPLAELLSRCKELRLDVMDEQFGYNCARFCGYADIGDDLRELAIEIYHTGALTYIADEI